MRSLTSLSLTAALVVASGGFAFCGPVKDVPQLLTEGTGYFAQGRWALADKRFRQILAIEPGNGNAQLLIQDLADCQEAWRNLKEARAHSAQDHPELLLQPQKEPFTATVSFETWRQVRAADAKYQKDAREILKNIPAPAPMP